MNKLNGEAQFKQTASNRLELKKGGGCIGCFGVPFFLAGIFMLLIGLQIVPMSNASEVPWWSWIVIFFMGVIFSAVGSGLVFGRNWISIDKTKRRIWIAWGLLRPMKGTEYQLDNYSIVLLKYDSGDSDSPAYYPISLKSSVNGSELSLCSFQEYGVSLKQAMLVSTFLHLPLQDVTTDHHTKLMPEHIAQNLKPIDQEEIPQITSEPAHMKSKVSEDEKGLQILIPGPAFRLYHLVGLAFPLFFLYLAGFPLLSFFNSTHTPQMVQMIFIGFIGLFFVLLPTIEVIKAFVISKSYTTKVNINTTSIDIEYRAGKPKKLLHLKAEEIMAIDYSTRETAFNTALDGTEHFSGKPKSAGGISAPYAPLPRWITWMKTYSRSKGIFIKTQADIYSFGEGLPDEEVYHLYTLVRNYLKPQA